MEAGVVTAEALQVWLQVLQPPEPGGVIYVFTGDPLRSDNLPPGAVRIIGRGSEDYEIAGAPKYDWPQHTAQQAQLIAMDCQLFGFRHVTLRVSAYHAYRAFLTVLRALQRHSLDEAVRLDVSAHPWDWQWTVPDGDDPGFTRLELVAKEMEKVERYRVAGDVATDAEALAYFGRWG
jgi:hypothetical protein